MNTNLVLEGLDDSQKSAVTQTEGEIIVLAGPGSGKTLTLVRRAAYIILNGTPGDRVLLMTFTNNAAKENLSRIETFLRNAEYTGPLPYVGTFHHTCLELLREYAGYTKTVLDEGGALRTLTSSTKTKEFQDMTINTNQNGTSFTYNGIQYHHSTNSRYDLICKLKDNLISPFEFATTIGDKNFSAVYSAYEEELFKTNSIDFGGIIMDFADELNNNQEFFDIVTGLYDYVMIDEAHDSNLANLWTFRQICSKKDNVAIVCDDDQQIYAWRGADERFLKNFKDTFPNAKEIVLNVNYRSKQEIVDASSNLISHNTNRQNKVFISSSGTGGEVVYHLVNNIWEYGKRAAEVIHSDYIADTAVLTRRRIEAYTISDVLNSYGIKTRIVGLSNAARKEYANKMIAYLMLLLDTDHIPSLHTALQTISGIGEKTASNLRCDWMSLKNHKSKRIESFYHIMKELWLKTTNKDRIDYIDSIIDPNTTKDVIISQFLSSLKYSRKPLLSIIDSMRLITESDEPKQNNNGTVQIMTIHGSKGLEFERVIMIGATDGYVKGNIDEERRLAYVAMTRAKRVLHIMGIYGNTSGGSFRRIPTAPVYPPFHNREEFDANGGSFLPQFMAESLRHVAST